MCYPVKDYYVKTYVKNGVKFAAIYENGNDQPEENTAVNLSNYEVIIKTKENDERFLIETTKKAGSEVGVTRELEESIAKKDSVEKDVGSEGDRPGYGNLESSEDRG